MSVAGRSLVSKHYKRKASPDKNSTHIDYDENMPILLRKKQKFLTKDASHAKDKSVAKSNQFRPVNEKNFYRLQFDPSINLEDIWVDAKTLDYMNKYRDNIFVSSNFMQVEKTQPKLEVTRMQPSRSSRATDTSPKANSKQNSAIAAA